MPRVMLRLSLVWMLTVLVSACAVQALPPLARVVGTEAQSSMTPLIAGGAGLGLGAGILATMRRRRRRRGAASAAAWSVLADIPGRHDAAFSLAPVVEDPVQHVDTEADAPERGGDGVDDDAAETSWLGELAAPDGDDAETSWLGDLAEPEPDDDGAAPASPPSAEQVSNAPWWADEASGNQAVDERSDPDDVGADDTIERAPQADRPFDTTERR